jgi:hypothetical protein
VALYGAWLTTLGGDDTNKTDRLRKVKAWCEAR